MKTKAKPTIATRIDADDLAEIDAIAEGIGQSRSEWLYQTIREALGQSNAVTVQAMSRRLAQVEKRLAMLGKALGE